MRLINETHWKTTDLRAIFTRAGRKLGKKVAQPPLVLISYTGNRTPYSGETSAVVLNRSRTARINYRDDDHGLPTTKIRQLFLPREGVTAIAVARAASQLIKHGGTTRTTNLREEALSLQKYEWASALPIEKRPPVVPPSTDEKLKAQLRNAEKRIRSWEVKLKLAETKLKKWKRKKTRLEYRIRTRGTKSKPAREKHSRRSRDGGEPRA